MRDPEGAGNPPPDLLEEPVTATALFGQQAMDLAPTKAAKPWRSISAPGRGCAIWTKDWGRSRFEVPLRTINAGGVVDQLRGWQPWRAPRPLLLPFGPPRAGPSPCPAGLRPPRSRSRSSSRSPATSLALPFRPSTVPLEPSLGPVLITYSPSGRLRFLSLPNIRPTQAPLLLWIVTTREQLQRLTSR